MNLIKVVSIFNVLNYFKFFLSVLTFSMLKSKIQDNMIYVIEIKINLT